MDEEYENELYAFSNTEQRIYEERTYMSPDSQIDFWLMRLQKGFLKKTREMFLRG